LGAEELRCEEGVGGQGWSECRAERAERTEGEEGEEMTVMGFPNTPSSCSHAW